MIELFNTRFVGTTLININETWLAISTDRRGVSSFYGRLFPASVRSEQPIDSGVCRPLNEVMHCSVWYDVESSFYHAAL